ncbi:hypothetical protein EIP86_003296 [Pleurotus ostreatoroseus]|nr:hypothetical protein EIP86_003296 [Pleurotus ostreatoroseus]
MTAQESAPNNIPYFMLNNGQNMPAVGMGCWLGFDGGGDAAEEMCKNALKCGYRHFDTAWGYNNEESVGKAIRESGVPRSEIFLTTKLWNANHHRVREAFEMSLAALDCEYIDLYLMHWPQAEVDGACRVPDVHEAPTFVDTWKEMEKLLETGKVKSIGVSNFSIKNLEHLLPHCKVIPVTNQVQLHPCLPQTVLKAYCEAKGILLTAYSPFGQSNPLFFKDPDFERVAKAHGATPAQVAISWAVQRGTAVVPKSANPERMKQNLQLVRLTSEDMSVIDAIHAKPGMHRNLLSIPGDRPGVIFGWTYEQLGWNWALDDTVIETKSQ